VLDELWARLEPWLSAVPRRADHPGRKPLDARKVLRGILFALYSGCGNSCPGTGVRAGW
jgi:transposase